MMGRTEQNIWLDGFLFVDLLITALTGSTLWLAVPHKMDIIFLGLSRGEWITVHIFFWLVGLSGILIHLVWHRGWLKALRGRPISGLSKKLRANRIVDRILWILYIAVVGFGAAAWAISFSDSIYRVSLPDRLHVVFGVAWTILLITHLVLHRKWIVNNARRQIHANLKGSKDHLGQENF
jgi:hypothetical protein